MSKPEVIIERHKLKQIGLLIIAIGLASMFFLMMTGSFQSGKTPPIVSTVLGTIGLLFFGFIGLLILISILQSKPALLLNSEGLTNNSNSSGGYFIRWKNIKSFEIVAMNRQKLIQINLSDEAEIYLQMNAPKRIWMKLNSKMMGSPAYIPSIALKMKLEPVLEILEKQRKLNSK